MYCDAINRTTHMINVANGDAHSRFNYPKVDSINFNKIMINS